MAWELEGGPPLQIEKNEKAKVLWTGIDKEKEPQILWKFFSLEGGSLEWESLERDSFEKKSLEEGSFERDSLEGGSFERESLERGSLEGVSHHGGGGVF